LCEKRGGGRSCCECGNEVTSLHCEGPITVSVTRGAAPLAAVLRLIGALVACPGHIATTPSEGVKDSDLDPSSASHLKLKGTGA
jgi:hypothetical protein